MSNLSFSPSSPPPWIDFGTSLHVDHKIWPVFTFRFWIVDVLISCTSWKIDSGFYLTMQNQEWYYCSELRRGNSCFLSILLCVFFFLYIYTLLSSIKMKQSSHIFSIIEFYSYECFIICDSLFRRFTVGRLQRNWQERSTHALITFYLWLGGRINDKLVYIILEEWNIFRNYKVYWMKSLLFVGFSFSILTSIFGLKIARRVFYDYIWHFSQHICSVFQSTNLRLTFCRMIFRIYFVQD